MSSMPGIAFMCSPIPRMPAVSTRAFSSSTHLQVGVNEKFIRMHLVRSAWLGRRFRFLRSRYRCQVRVDILRPHAQPRKDMPGICSACGDEGAIFAYSRAAASPSGASAGVSQV